MRGVGKMNATHGIMALLLGISTAGCQSRLPHAQHWLRTELYFGLSIHGGGTISEADWQTFVDEQVTPRFPDGLSIQQAEGQWKDRTGHIDHESSRVLILLHPRSDDVSSKIEEIRRLYKERFHQEAVMRVDSESDVDL